MIPHSVCLVGPFLRRVLPRIVQDLQGTRVKWCTEYTSRSLKIVLKETLCQRWYYQVEELREPEEECEASDKDDWQIDMPDRDEIDDVEEASVDNDSPHPRK